MASFRTNITVPLEIEIIEEIDKLAFYKSISRAAYIRLAIKEMMEKDNKEEV